MKPDMTRMFAEAAQAPHIVGQQRIDNVARIAELVGALRTEPPRAVLTCARGSSDHAATYAKYLIETRIGTLVSSASPSLASVYGVGPERRDVLCLAISQSGQSPDLRATVTAAAEAGARTVALVNDADSPLARIADFFIPIGAGPETSVAATKSYIGSLSAIAGLVAAWGDDKGLGRALAGLEDDLERAWMADWSAMSEKLLEARGLFVIGRGIGLGVAQEAALKFKETCGLHAEAFSAAEVRHGPVALVGPDFPLLVFRQSDETAAGVDELIEAAVARGATVLVAGEAPRGAISLPTVQQNPAIEPIIQIQSFYRAVNALSLARGYHPDQPRNLSKVTETV